MGIKNGFQGQAWQNPIDKFIYYIAPMPQYGYHCIGSKLRVRGNRKLYGIRNIGDFDKAQKMLDDIAIKGNWIHWEDVKDDILKSVKHYRSTGTKYYKGLKKKENV
jgi:hypothetical protein